jgi:hypothetical protein
MYVIYKVSVDKTYYIDDIDTKIEVKLIESYDNQSEAARLCSILSKENKDERVKYKYGYLKDKN